MKKSGTLYLIPTFLYEGADEKTVPVKNLEIIYALDSFIAEREKTARAFLKRIRSPLPQSSFTFFELNEHTRPEETGQFLSPLLEGRDMGLMSEAGMPCLADPGAIMVSLAHKKGIKVKPLPGPSSIIQALAASGLNGQNFAFNGYLPVDKAHRVQRIRQLEKQSAEQKQTQLFIETPYRNNSLLDDIIRTCRPQTLLCLASWVDDPENEFILTQSIAAWKKQLPDLHKKPTVFIIQA